MYGKDWMGCKLPILKGNNVATLIPDSTVGRFLRIGVDLVKEVSRGANIKGLVRPSLMNSCIPSRYFTGFYRSTLTNPVFRLQGSSVPGA
jgi:hypothetical protein